MILADWIIIGLMVVFSLFGMLFGFGKGLKFFTGGIIGVIISVVVCYALGGLIYNIGFVKDLLESLNTAIAKGNNGFCRFLANNIHIEVVIYYIALFIIVSILRVIIVKIIKSIVEIDNMALIIINKTLGVIFFVTVFAMLLLMVFWIVSLIGGRTEANFILKLTGSKLKLDWLFYHNPFMTIIREVFRVRVVV